MADPVTFTPATPGIPAGVPTDALGLPLVGPRVTRSIGSSFVIVSFEVITPELAKTWLELFNTINRPLQPGRADGHVRDMLADNWWFVGDTIRFGVRPSGEEVLLDGQHRLTAVAKSGIPQVFLVVRGLPMEAMEAIDTNKIRSVPDTLRQRAKSGGPIWSDENNIAAIANRLLLWERDVIPAISRSGGGAGGGRSATKAEQLAYIDSHANEIRDSIKVVRLLKNFPHPWAISPSALACAWALLARIDHADADLFIVENLLNGLRIEDVTHPAAALRRRLSRTDQYAPSVGEAFLLTLKAWNHYRDGDKIEKLQAPRNGWPKPSEFRLR